MSARKLMGIALLSAAFLIDCHQLAARAAGCEFTYSSAVAEKLVIPMLKRRFGKAYVYFDFDAPIVFRRKGEVVVQLSATRVVAGNTLVFEDLFFVEIDPCSKNVSRYYETHQYHNE